jgi:hypothetical protein
MKALMSPSRRRTRRMIGARQFEAIRLKSRGRRRKRSA